MPQKPAITSTNTAVTLSVPPWRCAWATAAGPGLLHTEAEEMTQRDVVRECRRRLGSVA